MNVIFHGKTGQRISLIEVAYDPGLGLNLYLLHAVQRTHLIMSGASGTHITSLRSSSGLYLRATRLPAGTVGARQRERYIGTTKPLRQLQSIYPIYSYWGAENIRLQLADRSVDRCHQQDARMGFHICIVGYVFGIPVSLLLRAPTYCNDNFFLSLTQLLLTQRCST